MKRFLRKKWHHIPVGIVAVLMALVLIAGSAFAAVGYGFFTGTLEVDIEEAMVLGMFDTWDNLHPYGSDPDAEWVDSGAHDEVPPEGVLGDVTITLGGTLENPEIIIATVEGFAGAGFVAGEWIVIPVNFRNAGDGDLTLGASVTGDSGLVLEYNWQQNTGAPTGVESGQEMARGFKDNGDRASLNDWTGTIGPKGGKSGSAVIGAQVLFVRISVPGNAVPEPYTIGVTFSRS